MYTLQELLTTLPVEKLVSKDTSMVHEIRVRNFSIFQQELTSNFYSSQPTGSALCASCFTLAAILLNLNLRQRLTLFQSSQALDGDMQMLVYENYNKFISATETIKRMKNNVDAMDSDMESVR